ncbi:amino acid ABC transporter substrate-binding protein [Chengkuizengella axinellae]|uniref:Amino acid ABC transporter substrate-binding protein n=1 Tax=Chengkuizengella axinellae TaxID=3064388 RepID=A0ABT9IYV5_9BACL|nr:amino acid ABC transporter substrate-binding protein [Chengkuizengella sp. 2205SS18-9]MDP5274537.1 amino acid ABC transporter substrate-binding protein [Chengkuizengella sp. 2205SS18-9]
MTKKRSVVLCIIIIASMLLFSCATPEENNEVTEENEGTESIDLLSFIQESGVIKVGTEGTYPPFTFHDEKDQLTGFDVEIAREVAARLNVEAEFMETQWDGMMAGLDAKRFDMIVNQVGITPDRQEKYDFSIPYITSSAVIVTGADNENVNSVEDIKGLTSAQSLTSNYESIALQYGAEIEPVEGFAQAISLIQSKRVDITINDRLTVLDYVKQKGEENIKVLPTPEEKSSNGILFRKGNETLVEAINQAIEDMMEDGTYLEISMEWFGEDVSK